MRRLLIFICAYALMTPLLETGASAEEVLVVLSIKSAWYQQVLAAAQSACGVSTRVINLAEMQEVNLPQIVRTSHAKAVVAIGDRAYRLANLTIQKIPVFGALVSDQKTLAISYMAPPERYLATFRKLGRKSIGVVFSDQSSAYVRRAMELARSFGINLVTRQTSTSTGAVEEFNAMKGQIDGLWLIPDTNILTSGTAELILHQAHDRRLPVVSFANSYLKSGAAVAIEPDRASIGRIIGSGMCSVINDEVPSLSTVDAYLESTNALVLERLKPPKKLLN